MCFGANEVKLALLLLLFFGASSLQAETFEAYENTCKGIGFKPKTPAYGECVLELRSRDQVNAAPSAEARNTNSQGDGSSKDITCQKYGFNPQSDAYKQCRLQLDIAERQFVANQAQYEKQKAYYDQQQRQYEQEKEAYEQRVAEIKKQKEREKGLKLLELGLRMGAGQSIQDASMATAGIAPIPPQAPPKAVFENYSVRLPNGRTTNCTYNAAIRSMNCY